MTGLEGKGFKLCLYKYLIVDISLHRTTTLRKRYYSKPLLQKTIYNSEKTGNLLKARQLLNGRVGIHTQIYWTLEAMLYTAPHLWMEHKITERSDEDLGLILHLALSKHHT